MQNDVTSTNLDSTERIPAKRVSSLSTLLHWTHAEGAPASGRFYSNAAVTAPSADLSANDDTRGQRDFDSVDTATSDSSRWRSVEMIPTLSISIDR